MCVYTYIYTYIYIRIYIEREREVLTSNDFPSGTLSGAASTQYIDIAMEIHRYTHTHIYRYR